MGNRCVWQAVSSTAVLYGSLALFTSVLHNVFLLYYVETFVSVYKIDKISFWVGEVGAPSVSRLFAAVTVFNLHACTFALQTVFLIWNSLNDPLFGWLSDYNFLTSPP